MLRVVFAVCALAAVSARPLEQQLSLTPPMGWMSWELFRCETDCAAHPTACINAALYESMADALVAGGFAAAGYTGVHVDDCWAQRLPPRDPRTGSLVADLQRFPDGMAALGAYLHARNLSFGLYTAESPTTCEDYPGSQGHEAGDAATFASWGVDYLKVDGCAANDSTAYYPIGYPKMGAALRATGRPIVYSCSWPAYLGDDEASKPYAAMIAAGCHGWRNYDDMQCSWASLSEILEHYGAWSAVLQTVAGLGPYGGHFNDADMLLAGNPCVTDSEARSQMAVWCVLASPLILGNDVRHIAPTAAAILLNRAAIAVSQDPLALAGRRVAVLNSGTAHVWARNVTNGLAVALVNMADYPQDLAVAFGADLGLPPGATFTLYDIWAQTTIGVFGGMYAVPAVPAHDAVFLRFTPVAATAEF